MRGPGEQFDLLVLAVAAVVQQVGPQGVAQLVVVTVEDQEGQPGGEKVY